MQDNTVADYREHEYRLPSPSLLNVMYCVRVSLWTVELFLIFLAQHKREGGHG
jgi:hypothetical protein